MIALAIGGCSVTTPPDPAKEELRLAACSGPARSLDPALAAALPPRTGRMVPDDQWADLAELVPGGFAGFLHTDHGVELMLTDPSQASAAKAALAGSLPDGGPVAVRQVRWDFAQLVDWYNYLNGHLTPGVTMSDKDEVANRIRYEVIDAAARDLLVARLTALDVPCDLIRITVGGRIREL